MQNRLALALVALFVAGCSSPPHELPTRGESKTFTVKESSDVVYRKIVEGTRTCYSKKEIAADFFPDNKTGRVSMSVKSSLNIATLFTAEIMPGKNGSSVQVYYLKGNPIFAEAIEEWTTGNYSKCPFS
jgi:hypothetical protein